MPTPLARYLKIRQPWDIRSETAVGELYQIPILTGCSLRVYHMLYPESAVKLIFTHVDIPCDQHKGRIRTCFSGPCEGSQRSDAREVVDKTLEDEKKSPEEYVHSHILAQRQALLEIMSAKVLGVSGVCRKDILTIRKLVGKAPSLVVSRRLAAQ